MTRHTSFTETPKSRAHPQGFTLVELIMIVAVFSFVLACASVALATMWRAQSDVQAELTSMAASMQLARQLRADAHLAHSAQLITTNDGHAVGVTFNQPNSHTDYKAANNRVTRVLQVNGTIIHREVFVLHEAISTTWTLSNVNAPLLQVTFGYASALTNGSAPLKSETIDAVVGLIAGEQR